MLEKSFRCFAGRFILRGIETTAGRDSGIGVRDSKRMFNLTVDIERELEDGT
jgi:hypothetical protein